MQSNCNPSLFFLFPLDFVNQKPGTYFAISYRIQKWEATGAVEEIMQLPLNCRRAFHLTVFISEIIVACFAEGPSR